MIEETTKPTKTTEFRSFLVVSYDIQNRKPNITYQNKVEEILYRCLYDMISGTLLNIVEKGGQPKPRGRARASTLALACGQIK